MLQQLADVASKRARSAWYATNAEKSGHNPTEANFVDVRARR